MIRAAAIKRGELVKRSALIKKRALSHLQNESGNVESALILIPLLILFLTVAQVSLSVYSRTVSDQETQGAVAYAAMGAAGLNVLQGVGNRPLNPGWSSPLSALPLPGGGSLLVGERQERGPSITPLLPGGDSYGSVGVAIQE